MQKIDIGTYHILCDDLWHSIEVNGRMLTLSPTQYRLCRFFLSTSIFSENSEEMVLVSYRLRNEIQTKAGISRPLLTKHISNLNGRCVAIGLQFCAFRDGYILIVSSIP